MMLKELLIAAALTFCVGVQQDVFSAPSGGCADPDPVVESCAFVYKVKMTMKEATGKPLFTEYDPCGDEVEAVCYRETTRTSLVGYLYACNCLCYSVNSGGELFLTMWDPKKKLYRFFNTGVYWDILNVIGKKANKTECAWSSNQYYDENHYYGFGSYDKQNMLMKSASGYLVGLQDYVDCDLGCELLRSVAYTCDGQVADMYRRFSARYGTWKIIYSKKLSKEHAADGNFIFSLFPDYPDIWGGNPFEDD